MNIFFLHADPIRASNLLIDAHMVKMPLESAQILCTCAHLSGIDPKKIPYKPTHQNHPCVRWTMSSYENVEWVMAHLEGLLRGFERRFGHPHKGVVSILPELKRLSREVAFSAHEYRLTPPALVMTEWYKLLFPAEDPFELAVTSYRNYYLNEKLHIKMGKANSPYERFGGNLPKELRVLPSNTPAHLRVPDMPVDRPIYLQGHLPNRVDLSSTWVLEVKPMAGGGTFISYKDRQGRPIYSRSVVS